MRHDPERKLKSTAARLAVRDRQTGDNQWTCCQQDYVSIEDISRHVWNCHSSDIELWVTRLAEQRAQRQQDTTPRKRRAPKGASDPIALACECDPQQSRVILFYKYTPIDGPEALADEHLTRCAGLTGKVRLANEGINGTLAGPIDIIDAYVTWMAGILGVPAGDRYDFFKPSPGCLHVFSDLSVRVVDEICPLGRPDITLASDDLHADKKLAPDAFHAKALDPDVVLLDTRNYYESRIGAFEGAITPAIRKFSRFPDFVDRNRDALEGKTILAYCTGGIRCEKATAYMRKQLETADIYMLKGGIHNYLEWKKQNHDENLWHGKNYVFDARQALSAGSDTTADTLAQCQGGCGRPWDVYQKCSSSNCHLLVLYCPVCASTESGVYCCKDCKDGRWGEDDGVCACERQRRLKEMEPIQVSH